MPKKYDEIFTKDTYHIHLTIIPFLTATELSDTAMKRSNSDEEQMSDDDNNKVLTERDVGDINSNLSLHPLIMTP